MNNLERYLGRCLSAREVSEYLRCDISTVYRHFRSLGGVKVGSSYKFFEKRLIDALLGQTETAVDSSSPVLRQEISQLSQQQGRSQGMGVKQEAGAGKRRASRRDPHGLLA